jgi:hypothetical protein
VELLNMVGIPDAERRLDNIPISSRAACASA